MSRTGIGERIGLEIQAGKDKSHKTAVVQVFDEHAVDLRENLFEFQPHGGEGTQIGARKGHHQRRSKTVSLHIAHSNSQTASRRGNEVEIIAAGFYGRIGGCGHIEAGHGWWRRVEALLHFACQAKLHILFLAFS